MAVPTPTSAPETLPVEGPVPAAAAPWGTTDPMEANELGILAIGFLFLIDVPLWFYGIQIRLLPDFIAFAMIAYGARSLMADRDGQVPLVATLLALATGLRSVLDLFGLTVGPIDPEANAPFLSSFLWVVFDLAVLFGALHVVWEVCGAIAERAQAEGDQAVGSMARHRRLLYLLFVVVAMVFLMFSWLIHIATAAHWFRDYLFVGRSLLVVFQIALVVSLMRLARAVQQRIAGGRAPQIATAKGLQEPSTRPFR